MDWATGDPSSWCARHLAWVAEAAWLQVPESGLPVPVSTTPSSWCHVHGLSHLRGLAQWSLPSTAAQ